MVKDEVWKKIVGLESKGNETFLDFSSQVRSTVLIAPCILLF
jgi:hypothetical protein